MGAEFGQTAEQVKESSPLTTEDTKYHEGRLGQTATPSCSFVSFVVSSGGF